MHERARKLKLCISNPENRRGRMHKEEIGVKSVHPECGKIGGAGCIKKKWKSNLCILHLENRRSRMHKEEMEVKPVHLECGKQEEQDAQRRNESQTCASCIWKTEGVGCTKKK